MDKTDKHRVASRAARAARAKRRKGLGGGERRGDECRDRKIIARRVDIDTIYELFITRIADDFLPPQ